MLSPPGRLQTTAIHVTPHVLPIGAMKQLFTRHSFVVEAWYKGGLIVYCGVWVAFRVMVAWFELPEGGHLVTAIRKGASHR